MEKKKGIDAEIDKVLRIMEANPDTPADIAANLLNQARISGDGPLRQRYLRKAQKMIAEIDPHEEPEKLQELQAQVLVLQGRGGDTEIAHVTLGELVIPKRMRTPELMAALAQAARQAGIDPRRLVVGDRRNSVNPRTGQTEFREIAPGIDDMVHYWNDTPATPTPMQNPSLTQMASASPPSDNDNYPRGVPRQDACIQAGYECLDSDVPPEQKRMCTVAEAACDEAAAHAQTAPDNLRIIERFPHGRTVIVPGGGTPPISVPLRRRAEDKNMIS